VPYWRRGACCYAHTRPRANRTGDPVATPPPAAATAPSGVGQYRTEAEAKGHSPADTVVWINLKSKVYHFAGTTNEGAYMCEKEAVA
jgi:hypothetical protein